MMNMFGAYFSKGFFKTDAALVLLWMRTIGIIQICYIELLLNIELIHRRFILYSIRCGILFNILILLY